MFGNIRFIDSIFSKYSVCLNFALSLHQHTYFVCASSEVSGETAYAKACLSFHFSCRIYAVNTKSS